MGRREGGREGERYEGVCIGHRRCSATSPIALRLSGVRDQAAPETVPHHYHRNTQWENVIENFSHDEILWSDPRSRHIKRQRSADVRRENLARSDRPGLAAIERVVHVSGWPAAVVVQNKSVLTSVHWVCGAGCSTTEAQRRPTLLLCSHFEMLERGHGAGGYDRRGR